MDEKKKKIIDLIVNKSKGTPNLNTTILEVT